jgi:hypothetical protein
MRAIDVTTIAETTTETTITETTTAVTSNMLTVNAIAYRVQKFPSITADGLLALATPLPVYFIKVRRAVTGNTFSRRGMEIWTCGLF